MKDACKSVFEEYVSKFSEMIDHVVILKISNTTLSQHQFNF